MRGVSSIRQPLRRAALTVVAVLAGGAGALAAEGPGAEPDSIFAAVRAAAARGHVEKTPQVGFDLAKNTFRDTRREGGLLIGFDVGLGMFGDREVIYALRPLYLTAEGEVPSERYGLFTDRHLADRTVVKSKVTHQVRVKAKPGYSVGGISLRTGLAIDGMSLTFMRIAGQALDPREHYDSDWVGNSSGGRESSLGGSGNLIVGVFGCQDEHDLRALGLLYVAGPPPAAGAPAPPPPTPKPVELPAEPDGPVADRPSPSAPPAAAAAAREDSTAQPERRPAKQPGDFGGAVIWLPFLAFGAVFVLFAGALVMFAGRKEKRPAETCRAEERNVAVACRPRRPAPPADEPLTVTAVADEQVTTVPPAPPLPPPQIPLAEHRTVLPAELENQGTGGMAIASLVLGVISLLVCCLPILGLPLSITGLIFGLKGQKSLHQSKAVIGTCLNLLGLLVAAVNGLFWLRFAIASMHWGLR
jgi:hypothetical protein